MPADLRLPGEFLPHKTYLLSGKTLMAWRDALVADRILPGRNLTLADSPRGRVLHAADNDTRPNFSPRRWERTSETQWKCEITPGFVVERLAAVAVFDPAIISHTPKIGSTALTAEPAPELTMLDGQYAVAKLPLDNKGKINGNIPITAETSLPPGTLYVPPGWGPPSSVVAGETGEYWFPLFQLVIKDGAPTYIPWQQDDIEWDPWIWTANHLGDTSQGLVYRSYDPATGRHDFRSIKSPNAAFGGLRKPVTTETDVEILGNNFWGDLKFYECAIDGESSPGLSVIIAVRDGVASLHTTEETLPPVPSGVTPAEIIIEYAGCHCCGDGGGGADPIPRNMIILGL